MTPLQRETIRELFAVLGVTAARTQFAMVEELTGVRISSVSELTVQPANVLIHRLRALSTQPDPSRTGNAWIDRDEPTWIDRM